MNHMQTREELLRHVGDPAQLAAARRFIYADGAAKGMRAADVYTGSGLRFTVLEDRCLDLYELSYKGVNLSFLSKNGPVSGDRFSTAPGAFTHIINGGMMFTAGLLNVGGACTDEDGTYHPAHGRISGVSAEESYARTTLGGGGELSVELGGRMRETALFGENLSLTRKITSTSESPCVVIEDILENLSPTPTEITLLYHFNLGFPFLDEGVRLYTRPGKVIPRTPQAAAGLPEYDRMTAPVDNFFEHVFFHELSPDAQGDGAALAVNDRLSLGVYIKYRMENLPLLAEWKSMRSGDYALGLEPSNNYIRGRLEERKSGTLRSIGGFAKLSYRVELGVLDGAAQITAFRDALQRV